MLLDGFCIYLDMNFYSESNTIPLIDPLGMWPAIAINIALYSATHIPKGLDETIEPFL